MEAASRMYSQWTMSVRAVNRLLLAQNNNWRMSAASRVNKCTLRYRKVIVSSYVTAEGALQWVDNWDSKIETKLMIKIICLLVDLIVIN